MAEKMNMRPQKQESFLAGGTTEKHIEQAVQGWVNLNLISRKKQN